MSDNSAKCLLEDGGQGAPRVLQAAQTPLLGPEKAPVRCNQTLASAKVSLRRRLQRTPGGPCIREALRLTEPGDLLEGAHKVGSELLTRAPGERREGHAFFLPITRQSLIFLSGFVLDEENETLALLRAGGSLSTFSRGRCASQEPQNHIG